MFSAVHVLCKTYFAMTVHPGHSCSGLSFVVRGLFNLTVRIFVFVIS